eukprot:6181062-Pleurochrysis_carterae.AAC.1
MTSACAALAHTQHWRTLAHTQHAQLSHALTQHAQAMRISSRSSLRTNSLAPGHARMRALSHSAANASTHTPSRMQTPATHAVSVIPEMVICAWQLRRGHHWLSAEDCRDAAAPASSRPAGKSLHCSPRSSRSPGPSHLRITPVPLPSSSNCTRSLSLPRSFRQPCLLSLRVAAILSTFRVVRRSPRLRDTSAHKQRVLARTEPRLACTRWCVRGRAHERSRAVTHSGVCACRRLIQLAPFLPS